jgi:DNA polymerase III epsilon subunit-like protein
VRDLAFLEQLAERFGLLDRGGADQHRLLALARILDQLDIASYFSSAVR